MTKNYHYIVLKNNLSLSLSLSLSPSIHPLSPPHLRDHAEHPLDALGRPEAGGVGRHGAQDLLDEAHVVEGLSPDGPPELGREYNAL